MRDKRRKGNEEWEKGVREVTKEVTMVWKERGEVRKEDENKSTMEVIK